MKSEYKVYNIITGDTVVISDIFTCLMHIQGKKHLRMRKVGEDER